MRTRNLFLFVGFLYLAKYAHAAPASQPIIDTGNSPLTQKNQILVWLATPSLNDELKHLINLIPWEVLSTNTAAPHGRSASIHQYQRDDGQTDVILSASQSLNRDSQWMNHPGQFTHTKMESI